MKERKSERIIHDEDLNLKILKDAERKDKG
jgi:hypothetical protein